MTDHSKVGTEETSLVNEHGEPHRFDPEFKGPVRQRSCTDIICLLLFFAFIVGWLVVAIVATLSGDPSRLLYPTDSKGQVCGRDALVKGKPFLFFFDLTRCASAKVAFSGCPTPQVCVEKCPQDNWFYLPGTSSDKSKLICKEDAEVGSKTVSQLILDQDCAAYYVHSQSIAGRCIPNITLDSEVLKDASGKALSTLEGSPVSSEKLVKSIKLIAKFLSTQEVAEGVVEDIKSLWPFLLIGCVIAMVVSFLWILLLRLVARFMIWFSLIIFTALCGYCSYYTLNKYLRIRNQLESQDMNNAEKEFNNAISRVGDIETTWLVIFIVTISIFTICLIVLIFLRKRIAIAIALINEASKAVGSIMSTLVFPLIPYILHLAFIVVFLVVALLLASAGKPQYKVMCNGDCPCSPLPENSTCSPDSFSAPECTNQEAICHFFAYEKNPIIQRLHIYNIVAFIWAMFFISAFGEMVLAGTFSSWYWSFNKSKDLPTTPVLNSIGRTIRYHLGTLAFGSLIITIVRLIRLIFEYIDYKLKKYTDNVFVKCLTCMCRCCLWCLEKFLKFINRNAYVYCAIYGTNFCTSARKSFSLLMRNILRVVVLDKVTDFLLFIGKLVVTGGMAVLAFFIFSGEWFDTRGHIPEMHYYLTPVIIIAVATFFIASAFFDVYNMAVDTLFFCFLEDGERNDGSAERPYFMSKELMKILDNSNKLKSE